MHNRAPLWLRLLSSCSLTRLLPTASAQLQWNLRGLVEMIFDYLKLIRIYTKPKGAQPCPSAGHAWRLHSRGDAPSLPTSC